MVLFDDVFNYIWHNKRGYVFLEIRDTYDIEIRLQLREIETFNFFQINIICGLDIVLNRLEIWSWDDFVSDNGDIYQIWLNKVNHDFWLDIFRALFMLETWLLLSSINFLILLLFIGTMTCFLEGSLVVMLICSLGLLLPLIIFYMFSILFTLRYGKASLILRTSTVLLPGLDAWVSIFLGCS